MVLFNQLHQARGSEELAFAVHRLRDSVRVKYENVSRLQRNSPLVIVHFFENSNGKPVNSILPQRPSL